MTVRLSHLAEDLEDDIRETLQASSAPVTRNELFRRTRADNYGNGAFADALQSLFTKGYTREVRTPPIGRRGRPTTTVEWIGSREQVQGLKQQSSNVGNSGTEERVYKWGPKDRAVVARLRAFYGGAAHGPQDRIGLPLSSLVANIIGPAPQQTISRVLRKLISEGFIEEYKNPATGESMIRAKGPAKPDVD